MVRSYGSHRLFDYARKRALSRAAARVGIDVEYARKQGLKKMGVNQRMAKRLADLSTEEVRDEHN